MVLLLRSLAPVRLRNVAECEYYASSRFIMSSLPFGEGIYRRELKAAIHVVERACRLCNSVHNSMSSMGNKQMEKDDLSPVTVADYGVQSLIGMELGLLFPSIPLVAEEDASYLRSEAEERVGEKGDKATLLDMVVEAVSKVACLEVQPVSHNMVLKAIDRGGEAKSTEGMPSFWVLDPIDGTRGFLEGGDALYVIGLALVVEGKIVLGVMGCPCLTQANMASSRSGRRILWAVDKVMNGGKPQQWGRCGVLMVAYRCHGTWLRSLNLNSAVEEETPMSAIQNFARSSVDGSLTLADASFGLSRHESWVSSPLASLVDPDNTRNEDFVFHYCCGSLCKYLAVATGAISALLLPQVKTNVKVWDHAAGVVCVMEAGGKVTDGEGFDIASKFLSKGQRTFVPGGEKILVTNGHLHHVLLEHLSQH